MNHRQANQHQAGQDLAHRAGVQWAESFHGLILSTSRWPLRPALGVALTYLHQTDLTALPNGRHVVATSATGDIVAIVDHYITRPAEDRPWEAHRAYIDVQCVVDGEEAVGLGTQWFPEFFCHVVRDGSLRDALHGALDPDERRALHRTLAGLREADGAPFAIVAHHAGAADPATI